MFRRKFPTQNHKCAHVSTCAKRTWRRRVCIVSPALEFFFFNENRVLATISDENQEIAVDEMPVRKKAFFSPLSPTLPTGHV